MVYSLVSVYILCGSMAFQPQPNSDTRCPDSVHPALPGRFVFSLPRQHPLPSATAKRDAAVRVQLRAAAVPPAFHGRELLCPLSGSTSYIFLLPSASTATYVSTAWEPINEVSFEYQALWIQTGFYFITTCLVYRLQILQSRNM